MRRRLVLLVALAGLASLSPALFGQQPPVDDELAPPAAVAEVRSAAGLLVSADLRADYLAGRPLLVTVRVTNPSEEALSFPNLEQRPHLVRFELISDSGKRQTRYTTPPAEDEDDRWTVAPSAARQTTLEIPSGGALAPGGYTLTVHVQDGEQSLPLGPQQVTLVSPHPVAVDVGDEAEGFFSLGWMIPWVQAGAQGADLYLDVRAAAQPAHPGYSWYLAHLAQPVSPWLSASRPSDGASRYLYWQDGRSLTFARLEDRRIRRQPRQLGLPYPRWEPLARGGTDAQAGLCVPLWVPAPSGDAGDVRLACVDNRGAPAFRPVVKLPERPQAATWVDAAGQLRLLLLHEGKLDLYTLTQGLEAGLPPGGRRLLPQIVRAAESDRGVAGEAAAPTVGQASAGAGGGLVSDLGGFIEARLAHFEPPVLGGARFAALPDRPEQPGGTMVFAWSAAEGEPAVVSGLWMSLEGRIVAQVWGVALPPGHRIAQVQPRGYDPLVLLSVDQHGVGWASAADWEAPIELGSLSADAALRVDAQGALWLVRGEDGKGIVAKKL
ncbi:MAG: hypothetical protein ABIO70_04850 [Pseudomonadota bacterium]